MLQLIDIKLSFGLPSVARRKEGLPATQRKEGLPAAQRKAGLPAAQRKAGQNEVLKGLSLDLPTGTIQGIAGLNGSGKTTLLNVLYGKLKAQSGSVMYEGRPLMRSDIAFLETHNYFYSRITGAEYLKLFKAANPQFDYLEWNKLFGLPLHHLIDAYSTGMKKKLAFLGILSLQRPILIVDEPFNGLDLETNETLKQLLILLKERGKTVIITSHILETLTSICDGIHYLNDGVIEHSFVEGRFDGLADLLKRFKRDGLRELVDGMK